MQISQLIRQSAQQLSTVSDSPQLDAEILLTHCLQKPRSFLYTWPEYVPEHTQLAQYETLLQQRLSGQPIAYLTGQREFWGLEFKVTPATLIPRPETELLIETTLQHFSRDAAINILDLGTGSGAIAIALNHELPNAKIIATDKSTDALEVAKENTHQHQCQHAIQLLESDWFSALGAGQTFDLIVSNPPYIADNDKHLVQGDVRFEPESALASGADGLMDIRHIITHAKDFLSAKSLLMLEHGYDQAQNINHLLQKTGYQNIRCLKDLAGNDRVSCGHYPSQIQ